MKAPKLCLAFLALTALAAQTPTAAPPSPAVPPPAAAVPHAVAGSGRDIIVIPDDAKEMHEDSLPNDRLKNSNPYRVPGAGPAAPLTTQTASIAGSESQTVVMNVKINAINDATEGGNRGVRIYQLTLKPKETVLFKLKGVPPGKILFSFSLPANAAQDAMFLKLKAANRYPEDMRMRRIGLTNVQDKPYTLFLKLDGYLEVPYTVLIERS
jgi:hypothetical protein